MDAHSSSYSKYSLAAQHGPRRWSAATAKLGAVKGLGVNTATQASSMDDNERRDAFRKPLDATYWRRVRAVSICLAPVIVAAYFVSMRGDSMPIHAVSQAARLVLTEVFVIGLFAAVSPHEPTGRATMVALACMLSGISFSLLATFDRWSQWSASKGERTIRAGIPFVVSFLWLRLLYDYYWLQSCTACKGFRLCIAATNCIRFVGVLLLRFAVSPAVAAYPPSQLPFEEAVACNLLLMLVSTAMTPSNRMRLALASGLQTVRLSQLQPGAGSLAQAAQAEAENATSPVPLQQPTASSHGSESELILAAGAFVEQEEAAAAEHPLNLESTLSSGTEWGTEWGGDPVLWSCVADP